MSLPGDWISILGEDYQGSVLFTRSFRCPQAISAAVQVFLEVEDTNRQATVELNNQRLGDVISSQLSAVGTALAVGTAQRCPASFDITRLLQPSNLLAVTVESNPHDEGVKCSGQLGLIRLAIH